MNFNKKKVLNISKSILVGFVVVFIYILSMQGIKINKDQNYIPSIFGHTYLNVLSGSMEPEFTAYDLIIGKKISNTKSLKVGDVVTFRDGQMLITHRITEINKETGLFKTKGDANETVDIKERKSADVVSVYKTKIPKAGYIISKFHNFIFLGLVWLIFMYFIASEIIKEIKKEKEKKQKLNEAENI